MLREFGFHFFQWCWAFLCTSSGFPGYWQLSRHVCWLLPWSELMRGGVEEILCTHLQLPQPLVLGWPLKCVLLRAAVHLRMEYMVHVSHRMSSDNPKSWGPVFTTAEAFHIGWCYPQLFSVLLPANSPEISMIFFFWSRLCPARDHQNLSMSHHLGMGKVKGREAGAQNKGQRAGFMLVLPLLRRPGYYWLSGACT